METGEHRLQIERSGRVVTLVGEIDAATCELLSTALGDGSDPATCLDMSGVTFIDSSGLRVLIAHRELLRASDRRLSLRDPSRSVQRLIEITGLADSFDILTG